MNIKVYVVTGDPNPSAGSTPNIYKVFNNDPDAQKYAKTLMYPDGSGCFGEVVESEMEIKETKPEPYDDPDDLLGYYNIGDKFLYTDLYKSLFTDEYNGTIETGFTIIGKDIDEEGRVDYKVKPNISPNTEVISKATIWNFLDQEYLIQI